MATYTIGSGGDYATFTAFQSGVTLPEAELTVLEVTGTVTEAVTFANINYTNGLTIKAKAGEEADGAGAGAFVDGSHLYSITTSQLTIENVRVRDIDATGFNGAIPVILNNLDIGENSTDDPFLHNSGSLFTLSNSIIRPAEGTSDDGIYSADLNNTNAIFNKVTVVGAPRFGALRGVFTDCLVLGSGTNADYLDGVTGSDYNASGDASAPGTTVFINRDETTYTDLVNHATGDYNLASGSSLNTAGSDGGKIGASLAAAAPTLSLDTPDTVTHGTATTATGDALNTVTTMNIKLDDDSVTLSQSFTLDVADLDFTPDIGQPTVGGGATAVSALPETGTGVTLSTGTTAYQNVLEVSDV